VLKVFLNTEKADLFTRKYCLEKKLLDASFESVVMFYNPDVFQQRVLELHQTYLSSLGRYKTCLKGCESFNNLQVFAVHKHKPSLRKLQL